ncbi:uncharacterized protein [Eucyclogobius newberryi]|uniref:uncharacterized protein isoform X1 n=1 Tax=Eucyclogobius newberryi TaxID=166745 RepID=UPI003B5BE982
MAVRLYEDKDHAAEYLRHKVMMDEVVSQITKLLDKRVALPAKLAVDVGCGSGQGTVLLAPFFSQVIGTDISPAQLENAQAVQKCGNVSYKQCPAEDLPFESGTVDFVTAMAAAHWFDQTCFLEEVNRVLRPGGCLALLTYDMDMKLEYGDVSEKLKEVCKEFYAALLPFRNPRLGSFSTIQIYKDMFNLCSYPDKEWHEGLEVRRPITVNGYISLMQTYSAYQKCKEKNSQEAEELSNRIRSKLLDTMQVSSPETEVTLVTKYFYWFACKP